MRIQKNKEKTHTLLFAFLFFAFIFIVIAGSFAWKGINVLRQSIFDGKHRFTILFQSQKQPQNTLVSFSPTEATISVLHINGTKPISSEKMSTLLGIPIDGYISSPTDVDWQKEDENRFIVSLFQTMLWQYKTLSTNLTFVDVFRLWMMAKSVPGYGITDQAYLLPSSDQSDFDTTAVDGIVSSLFADSTITQEKVSIHIINASGILGLGNRVARIITNSGGNVVAVSTGDSVLPVSQVAFSTKESYTLQKISELFRQKAVRVSDQSISDIVIIIGKDKAPLFAMP